MRNLGHFIARHNSLESSSKFQKTSETSSNAVGQDFILYVLYPDRANMNKKSGSSHLYILWLLEQVDFSVVQIICQEKEFSSVEHRLVMV